MIFEPFDEQYVRRLADGDSAAGDHFAAYFGRVLYLKLRMRLRSKDLIEEARQETLKRVLVTLRQGHGVRRPERFGAFVNAVCENVVRELCRTLQRYEPWDENVEEPIDQKMDLDAPLLDADLRREIALTMNSLAEKDRKILRAMYLDELDKAEICRQHQVDAGYLRVLIHRARAHFREAYDNRRDSGL